MVMTDPIADYLTRIRNANMAKHDSVEIPASNIKKSISEILKREGFIRDYEVADDNGERVISGLKRISKPGLRNYVSAEDLPKVLNGLGIAIVSTSAGVITDKEARQKNVGGEVIAYIW
jgi:small subunit ribosomal protein S8